MPSGDRDVTSDALKNVHISMTIASNLDRSKWSKKDRDTFDGLLEEMRQMTWSRQKASFMKTTTTTGAHRKLTNADLDWTDQNVICGSNPLTYSSTGPRKCLLNDSQTVCHHETCTRYNTDDGISYFEYDTIMNYSHRIRAAKGQRMKDALRKQRDCQLVKDKEDWDNWQQKVFSKMQHFGRDAYEALLGFVPKDQFSSDLLCSADEPKHSVILVGRTLSKLLSLTLSPERQEFCGFVIKRIKTGMKGSSQFWWNPAFYLSYFGPVEISHIDAAVRNVSDVLNLNAILPYEIHYCLRAFLKQFKDLLKLIPCSKKSRRGFTVDQAMYHAMHLINPATESEHGKQSSAGAPKEILDVLSECSALDAQARSKILDCADHCASTLTYPGDRFEKIKDRAVQSSPLPSVSEISLTPMLRYSKLACIWRTVNKRSIVVSKTQLIQELAQQIRNLAKDSASKFRVMSEELDAALNRGRYNKAISEAEQLYLKGLLVDAEATWVSEADQSSQDVATRNAQAAAEAEKEYQSGPSLCIVSIDQDISGMTSENCKEFALMYCKDFIIRRHELKGSTYNHSWFETIKKNMWRGVTEAFLVYRHFQPCSRLPTLHGDLSTLFTGVSNFDGILFEDRDNSLLKYLTTRYQQGWCPPATVLRFLIFLCHVSALNPASNKKILQQLDWLCQGSMQGLPVSWREPIQLLSLAVTHFYGFLVVECTHVFGRCDVDQVVMSILWLMMVHVLVAETKDQAECAFEYVIKFLTTAIGLKLEYIGLVRKRFLVIIENEKLRCVNLKGCATYPKSKGDKVKTPRVDNPEAQESE